MPIHLQHLAGFNHPNDKIEQDRKNASIYHRHVGSLNKSFKFKYHEFRPGGHDSVTTFNEMYERKLMDEYWLPFINQDSVVVDVGASYGIYTLSSALAGASKVYAFEPIKRVADILRKNVVINGWSDRIEIHDNLLWSCSDIDIRFDDKKDSTIIAVDDSSITIKSVSLDDLNLPKVDLIKIDVEGAELDVLYGAVKTINKFKPLILIEIHDKFIRDLPEVLKYFFSYSIQIRPSPVMTTVEYDRKYMIVRY